MAIKIYDAFLTKLQMTNDGSYNEIQDLNGTAAIISASADSSGGGGSGAVTGSIDIRAQVVSGVGSIQWTIEYADGMVTERGLVASSTNVGISSLNQATDDTTIVVKPYRNLTGITTDRYPDADGYFAYYKNSTLITTSSFQQGDDFTYGNRNTHAYSFTNVTDGDDLKVIVNEG